MQQLKEIWTLGPKGTNCEAAAKHYLATKNKGQGTVHLAETLEKALESVFDQPGNA